MADEEPDGVAGWAALVRLHEGLARLGPGTPGATRTAWARLGRLPEHPRVLDVGCGTGAATLVLAGLGATVTGVDLHAPFLETLHREAETRGLADRVTTRVADMRDLPFPDASFDVVWSEGAAYVMGVEAALAAWRRLLVPGGRLVLSDLVRFEGPLPPDVAAFWTREVPAMGTADDLVRRGVAAGYEVLGTMRLPPEGWAAYYGPLRERLAALRVEATGDAALSAVIEATEEEIAMFDRADGTIGYAFLLLAAPA